MVGASTAQNTAPVRVMDTVNTYLSVAHARGRANSRRHRLTACNTANSRQTAAIHRLDWMVKNKNAVVPAMKSPPRRVVRMTPAAAQAHTASCKRMEEMVRIMVFSAVWR